MMPSAELVQRLRSANRIGVLTGAGISAESGIATFRDPDGLWARFKPEELANVRAFLANPVLVQGWYVHRRDIVEKADPNPGHLALAQLAEGNANVTVITQNVDGLHQRAGSEDVVELHGSILRSYCLDCGADVDLGVAHDEPQRCPSCEGLVRPDVVWFGEILPERAITRAVDIAESADVFLSVGTSAVVYPAADLPLLARQAGAYTAEINVARSAIADQLDECLLGPAGEVLPQLLRCMRDDGMFDDVPYSGDGSSS